MKDTLQISVDSQKEGAVMYLQSQVDIKSSPDLRGYLLAMMRKPSPPETIIIDLNEVSSIFFRVLCCILPEPIQAFPAKIAWAEAALH